MTTERAKTHIREVPNRWDNHGAAYEVGLECGHHFYVTGRAVFNIYGVDCKTCGGSGKVRYYEGSDEAKAFG